MRVDEVLTLETDDLGPLRSPVMVIALTGPVRRRRGGHHGARPLRTERLGDHHRRDRPRPVLRLHAGAAARRDRHRGRRPDTRHPLAREQLRGRARRRRPRPRGTGRRRAAPLLAHLLRVHPPRGRDRSAARRWSPSAPPPRRCRTPARRTSRAAPPTPTWHAGSASASPSYQGVTGVVGVIQTDLGSGRHAVGVAPRRCTALPDERRAPAGGRGAAGAPRPRAQPARRRPTTASLQADIERWRASTTRWSPATSSSRCTSGCSNTTTTAVPKRRSRRPTTSATSSKLSSATTATTT